MTYARRAVICASDEPAGRRVLSLRNGIPGRRERIREDERGTDGTREEPYRRVATLTCSRVRGHFSLAAVTATYSDQRRLRTRIAERVFETAALQTSICRSDLQAFAFSSSQLSVGLRYWRCCVVRLMTRRDVVHTYVYVRCCSSN